LWRDRRPEAPHALAVLAGASVQGMTRAEYEQAAELLGVTLARSNRVMRDGVARARQYQQEGCRVVVATACEHRLAEAYLRAIGLEVAVVGSQLEPPSNAIRHNRGAAKVTALAQAGFTGPYLAAYSDSLTDAPMLREATTPVLVNPSAATWRRARVVIGERVRRVEWR
jgi:phosphatidylglycerophosphatase C